MAWALITVTYSLVPLYSLGRVTNNGLLIAAVWASTLDINSREDVIRLVRRFAEASALLAFLLVLSYLILPREVSWQSDQVLDNAGRVIWAGTGLSRFVGFLNQPNDVGMVMLTAVPTSLFLWPSVSRTMKVILLASISSMMTLTLLANSRSSMVALFIGACIYVVWRFRTRGLLTLVSCFVLAGGIFVATSGRNLSNYLARGDIGSLTGRTDIWAFTWDQIKESPFLGKGYQLEGEIFSSKQFPIWFGPWDKGPHSSLHQEYLSHAVGVGLPATLFWLFIVLRPWVSLFRTKTDPWNLKPLVLLAVLPILLLGLTESSAGDCHYSVGLLFMLLWSVAERFRLSSASLPEVPYARASTMRGLWAQ
jgi:O-antigen ligase